MKTLVLDRLELYGPIDTLEIYLDTDYLRSRFQRYHLMPPVPPVGNEPRVLELGVAAPANGGAKLSLGAGYPVSFDHRSARWDVWADLAWPGENPVIRKWASSSFNVQVALVAYLRWVDATACHAPQLQLRDLGPPRFRESTQTVVAPVLSSSPTTHVPNTGGTQVSRRYFCQPGTYSGDDWVGAAALLMQPDLRAFVVTYHTRDVDKTSKYLTKARQALAFYQQCGVSDRVKKRYLPSVKQRSDLDHLDPCRAWIEKDRERGDPRDVKLINITTSVLMSAVELSGISTVCASLRERFTATLDGNGRERARLRVAPLFELLEHRRVVLVNMRLATYNVENIITEAIYRQIVQLAKAFGYTVVRVGVYQDDDGYRKYGRWVKQLDDVALDIYGVNERGFAPADLRETAWFWALVSELQTKTPNLIGVIGGRSGSLDIAAFMGVRTLSFDIVDPREWEYIRMFMTYPLMSIAGRTGANKRPQRSTDLASDNAKALREGVIDPQALCHWLAGGHVVPIHALSPVLFLPQYRYLINARDRGPRAAYKSYLAYMEQHVDWTWDDDEEVDVVANEVVMEDDDDEPENVGPIPQPMPQLDPRELERQERIRRLEDDLRSYNSPEDYISRNRILSELSLLRSGHF